MKITSDLFNAYLHCPTKCWLRSGGEPRGTNPWADWVHSNALIYRGEGIKQLVRDIPSVGAGEPKSWKAADWLFAVDVTVQAFSPSDSYTLESFIDAVKRVSSPGRGKANQFIPVRFCPANKLTKFNRLLLAFDAWAISQALGCEVKWGLIVHRDRYIAQRVNTISLFGEVRKMVGGLAALLSSKGAPDLVLNRHCAECEFRNRCRNVAIQKDDLSLLEAMTEKERSKLHRKGIFTVTQLSYTFRPRKRSRRSANKDEQHHHSLQALAIREKKIHMVGTPDPRIKGTPIYLDVEGIPDRNFYYLIGLRVRIGELVQQHSLWAENTSREKEIWTKFLAILSTVQNPVVVHYGSYERSLIKQMYGRYGGPEAGSIVDLTLKSTVNLLALLFSKIYLPTYSNRLKDTAAYFGATWQSPDITGIQTIALRSEWEGTRSEKLKENLLAYNQDDCAALELLSQEIEKLVAESESRPDIDFAYSPKKVSTECSSKIHATLEDLLKTAWLDYTRNKIKIRKSGVETSNTLATPSLTREWALRKLPKSSGQIICVRRKRKCPNHPEHPTMLRPTSKDREHAILDIAFMKTGCRKAILRYRGKQSYCPRCGSRYSPPRVKDLRHQLYGKGFHAWVAYLRVALRLSYRLVAKLTRDVFHEEFSLKTLDAFFEQTADVHQPTEELLLRRILQSSAIHVDETKISILGMHQQVWVITNRRDVVFRLTETRETGFLQELLVGYRGVLVSDFYAGYDAITCRQQKCLVHLIRDLNDDLWKNPFNAEYEQFVAKQVPCLQPVPFNVSEYGNQQITDGKHRTRVDRFYRDTIDGLAGRQEILSKYKKRFERYRDSMFTFLGEDEIPWNNNAAERALRHLAVQRKISGDFSKQGARRYLRLLAIAQTCRFQNKSFLGFLLSGLTDVDRLERKRRQQSWLH